MMKFQEQSFLLNHMDYVKMIEELDEFHNNHSNPQYITRSDDVWNGYAMRWTIIQKKSF